MIRFPRSFRPLAASILVTALLGARPSAARDAVDHGYDFSWHGALAAGQTVEIHGILGPIQAEWTSGNEVLVTAVKSARKSDPDEVTIEVSPYRGGVVICALYPAPPGKPANRCGPPGESHSSTRDCDVQVSFRVRVPAGVRLVANTVNGDIEVDHLKSEVEARTVNGSISMSTRSFGEATTVNGSIDAELGDARWDGKLDFRTVNGSITLVLPSSLDTELSAETVNGELTTDFPITVRGKMSRHRFSGIVGDGGRELAMATVNGGIEVRAAR